MDSISSNYGDICNQDLDADAASNVNGCEMLNQSFGSNLADDSHVQNTGNGDIGSPRKMSNAR